MTAMAALPAASALTSERESGHWEALWLSPLSAWDIISGKLLGVLFGCAYWSLYLLPGMVPCLFGGVTAATAFSTVLMVCAEAWLCANVGLFWSALFHKSSTATNWTIISLVVLLGFMPIYFTWHAAFPYAIFGSLVPFIGGALLLLGTQHILRDAPRENDRGTRRTWK
jgi:ABC-type Na+ efflux pump permease subunit